jgi:hypothetical protein
MAWQVDFLDEAIGRFELPDAGECELLRQTVLQGLEHALGAPACLRRIGRDMLDAQGLERPAYLRQLLLGHRAAGDRCMKIMAAAIRIEARRKTLLDEHLEQGPKARRRAFLLNQKSRIDRARGIIRGHDQIERRLTRKPRRA